MKPPGAKVDARSERWREHRKKVRGEIVDAAFRAIDRLGPELSVREIAEEAGTAKPKIYRHFHDKSDLFRAIGERLRDMLWAAIFPSIDLKTDSAREVIRRAVEEYVNLVDQHPNVLRVFIQGRSAASPQILNEGRGITLAVADMFDNELREMELDHAAIELAGARGVRLGRLGHRVVVGSGRRQPAAHAARAIRRPPDDHHDRGHRRHRRGARHRVGPRPADPQRGPQQPRGELTAGELRHVDIVPAIDQHSCHPIPWVLGICGGWKPRSPS